MLRGEWESAKEIYRLMPGLIPQPLGYGQYKSSNPVQYFYVSEFIDMDIFTAPDSKEITATGPIKTTAPDPKELAVKIAKLHHKSSSPTGKFGFHVVTCDGKIPHTVDWQDSWAVFFGRLLRGICKIDVEANGPWPEMERATEQVISKVVPRLLGSLRHRGKPIKPCIIHGDLWEPNLGVNRKTGDLVVYDVGSYYAHNEMDLGPWRADYCLQLWKPSYTEQYLRYYPAAEPMEEFDDRSRLYSLKGSINYSAGHPKCIIRQS